MSAKTRIVITAALVIVGCAVSSWVLRETDPAEFPPIAGAQIPRSEQPQEAIAPEVSEPVREVASEKRLAVARAGAEPTAGSIDLPAFVADVRGFVVDPDGSALPGAQVFVFSAPGGRMVDEPVAQVRTAQDGSFSIKQARFHLTEPEGWVVGTHDYFSLGGTHIDARSDAPVTIKLQLPTRLHGMVVDTADEPIEAVDVALTGGGGYGYDGFRVPEGFGPTRVQTGPGGLFEFSRLPAGKSARLQVRCEGYTSYSKNFPLSRSENTEPVRIVLDAGSEIHGRVFIADSGTPVEGVEVGCQIQDGSVSPTNSWANTITDEEGRYRVTGLTACAWNVIVTLPGEMVSEWTVSAAEGVELEPGQIRFDVDFPLVPGALLEIQVFDADRDAGIAEVPIGIYSSARPRSGAAVQRVLSGEDGHVLVRVPQGPARVYVQGWAPGYLRVAPPGAYNLEVGEGEEHLLSFALLPAATVVGKVVDQDGVGVASALVSRFGGSWQDRLLSPSPVQTRADGSFELSGFEPGSEILVDAEKGDQGLPEPVRVEPDAEGNLTVTLMLQASLTETIRGRVLDPFGKPAAGVQVNLSEIGELDQEMPAPLFNWYTTDADGSFEIDGIRIGMRYRVRASMPVPETSSGNAGWWMATSEIVTGRAGSMQLPDLRLSRRD